MKYSILWVIIILWGCSKKSLDAVLLYETNSQLGEGAIWNDGVDELWWVDIEGRKFNRFDPATKKNTETTLHGMPGTVVFDQNFDPVLALESGIYRLNERFQEKIADPLAHQEHFRLNDGKCDPNGNLWVGSMSFLDKPEQAMLYRVSPAGKVDTMLTGVTISNGIVWSLDKRTLYYIDTPKRNVRAFDFDTLHSTISNERVVIEIPEGYGMPDGMTIDSNGNLWVALWDGFRVCCWDPDSGELLYTVNLPVPWVTSCAFGGRHMDTLYITTAGGKDRNVYETYPLSGSLFYVVIKGIKGVESFRFGH